MGPQQHLRLATPPLWQGAGDFGIVTDGEHQRPIVEHEGSSAHRRGARALSKSVFDFKESPQGRGFTLDLPAAALRLADSSTVAGRRRLAARVIVTDGERTNDHIVDGGHEGFRGRLTGLPAQAAARRALDEALRRTALQLVVPVFAYSLPAGKESPRVGTAAASQVSTFRRALVSVYLP